MSPRALVGLAAVSFLTAGAAVLSYVGWQLWGTSWVSEREHTEARAELASAWARDQVSIERATGTVELLLRVPRFGEDFAVPIVDNVEDDALAAGVGWVPGTARVGAVGNTVLAGHRITHGEPFRDLPSLAPGDTILIDSARTTYTYVLDTAGNALSLPHTSDWVLAATPDNPVTGPGPAPGHRRLLTLITCAELFHTEERLVVFGHLESTAPREGGAGDE